MRRLTTLLIIGLFAGTLFAEVTFSGLDLAGTDELLFTAEADAPGYGSYRTLLHADLSAGGDRDAGRAVAGGDVLSGVAIRELTHFPEILSYLPALRSIQIQNRLGIFRAAADTGQFEPVPGFSSFGAGARIPNGRVFPVSSSPDGRYLAVVEPTSPAYGDLVLLTTDGTSRRVVATRVELSTERTAARWSPDSKFFVYSRTGSVYYFSIEQYERGRLLDESFRELGPGALSSVRWSTGGSLYYVSGSLVYEIIGPEFFTRSLYAGLLQVGRIVGKIPFPFDPNFDSFFVGPDGETALLNKGGRNLFVLFLNPDDFVDGGQVLGLPSLFLPRNTRIRQVAWSALGDITILTGSIEQGSSSSTIFRMNVRPGATNLVFERMDDEGVTELQLSPNEERVALLTDSQIVFRDHSSWSLERTVAVDAPLHAVWLDPNRLLVGGRSTIDIVGAREGSRTVLGLAQADDYSIADDGTIIAMAAGDSFEYRGRWRPTNARPEAVT
ncbi:MAG TPA: polysaccharide deacetylase family protein, partial [Spirochaetia bacterium]|nr:polysaccharide deacetylase family protein [Spirochaetia bacterium]